MFIDILQRTKIQLKVKLAQALNKEMAAFLTVSVLLALLSAFCFMGVSPDQITIDAKPGEDVTLPCRPDGNKPIVVAEWRRTVLGPDEFVLLFRDDQFDRDAEYKAFKTRVDLKDIAQGDVSLILKNVMTGDTGIYECRVDHRVNNLRKKSKLTVDPISIVDLRVEQGIVDGRMKDTGNRLGGKNNVSVSCNMFFITIVFVGGSLIIYYKWDWLSSWCPDCIWLNGMR